MIKLKPTKKIFSISLAIILATGIVWARSNNANQAASAQTVAHKNVQPVSTVTAPTSDSDSLNTDGTPAPSNQVTVKTAPVQSVQSDTTPAATVSGDTTATPDPAPSPVTVVSSLFQMNIAATPPNNSVCVLTYSDGSSESISATLTSVDGHNMNDNCSSFLGQTK